MYPLFSIVVFREMTTTQHTISVLFLVLFSRILSGAASSMSESEGVSGGAGFRQTLLFRLFEGPRRAFDTNRQVLDLATCLIFSFWVASKYFCKVNSLFSLLFHEDLDLVLPLYKADIQWSKSLIRSERQKNRRTEWWLIASLHKNRMVHRSNIYVPWCQREIVCPKMFR
jgi:hypothetical protein